MKRGKSMNRVLSAGFALALGLAVSGCVHGDWGDRVKETVTEERPLARNGTFSLENVNGRVEVSGWDEERVKIEAVKRAGSEQALERMKIEIDAEADSVRVRTHHGRPRFMGGGGRVDYHVRVPRGARVSVGNVNGRVELHELSGGVKASTVNGSVEVADAAGEVRASSVNGSVEASLARVDPEGRSELSTTNGSVSLTLPADANAEIDAGTVNGHVSCDFDVADGRKTRRKLEGRIGSGGARFDLRAVNGSVSVDRGLHARAAREAVEETPKPKAEAEAR
jgi:hypothetical protein